MEDKLKTPDWNFWAKRRIITVPEAVWLSLNQEPVSMNIVYDLEVLCSVPSHKIGELDRRLILALQAAKLDKNEAGALERVYQGRDEVDRRIPLVRMIDFAEWAQEEGFSLPENFPTFNLRIKTTSEGEMIINFPYEVPILAAIKEVMVQYKEKKAINKPLQQKNVPKLLVKAMAKQKKILSMDAARRIATLIQPLDAPKDTTKKSPQ